MTEFKINTDSPIVKVAREYGKFCVTTFDYVFLVKSILTYAEQIGESIFEEGVEIDEEVFTDNISDFINQFYDGLIVFSEFGDIDIEEGQVEEIVSLMRHIAKYQHELLVRGCPTETFEIHAGVGEQMGQELWKLIYFAEND